MELTSIIQDKHMPKCHTRTREPCKNSVMSCQDHNCNINFNCGFYDVCVKVVF
jgi:hypothetical protein